MNQPGVASTVNRRQALTDQILEPERLEAKLGPELAQLSRNGVVQEVVAGHDGNRRGPLMVPRAEASEETEPVDERHPEIEDDGVGVTLFCFRETRLRADGGSDLIAFEAQHPGESLSDSFVVIDYEDFRCSAIVDDGWHTTIVSDEQGFRILFVPFPTLSHASDRGRA